MHPPLVATFSIAGFDSANGDLGVAVASRFLAVGAVVPHAASGVGAVATQSWANPAFGPGGLVLMSQGASAEDALNALIAADEERDARQVGIVDARGGSAAWTGAQCVPWAGHFIGEQFTCQGNILTGEQVVGEMAGAYRSAEGDLADRLLAALLAGEQAGGDTRGKQSAALLVVRKGGGYGGLSDRYIDIRVDDHPDPFTELSRLLRLWDATFLNRPGSRIISRPEGEDVRTVQRMLHRAGLYQGDITGVFDDATSAAVRRFRAEIGVRDGDWVDAFLMQALRTRAGRTPPPA